MLQSFKVFRFGNFALDSAQRRLLHGAQDLYLPPKTFELLLYLIQNSGRIITKNELLDAIWAGVNVNENTLAQRIREVREALHDGENGVSFIKTVPRVGYQFVGQVNAEERQGPANPNLARHVRENPRALLSSVVGFGVVAVAAVIAAFALSRANAPLLLDDHRFVSGFPASFREATLSPDGGTMAFVDDVDGRPQIWLKSLRGGGATQLTFLNGGAGPMRTRWSPTGDQILFNYAGGIWAVSPLGGAPRQIVQRGRNPSVSADGKRLVYEGLGVPDGDRGIWTADADGTNVRRVLDKQHHLAGEPAVSPDGRTIAFFQSGGGPMGDFWIVSTAGGPARRLTFDDGEAGTPMWTPDGRFVIFSSERAGSRTLWRIPAAGGEPQPVTSGAGEDRDPQISADGRRLIYTNLRNTFSLELLDSRSGFRQTLMQSRMLISGPRFSPDGERVAFLQKTAAGVHVFTITANAKDLRQITSRDGERNIVPRWSGAGDSLFYSQIRPKDSFRKISASGGESLEILPWSWDSKVELDPLERAIVFVRGRHVVVRDMQSAREITLDRSVDFPRWSPDGQTIFATETLRDESFNIWNVVRCQVASRSCSTLTNGHSVVPSPDGRRIYFMRPATGGMRSLWSADVNGRDERALGAIGPFRLPDVMFDVSRDDVVVWPAFHAGKPEIWTATLREGSTTR